MGIGIMTNYASRSESFFIKEKYRYLVDAGRTKNGENFIVKNKKKLGQLDFFVISHGDEDHIGLANKVIEELEPKVIILSPIVYALEKFRYTFNSENQNLPNLFTDEYITRIEIIEINDNEERSSKQMEMELFEGDRNGRRISDQRVMVYAVRQGTSMSSTVFSPNRGINEFETFPTLKASHYTQLIEDFINQVTSHVKNTDPWFDAINNHELINDLKSGRILKKYNLKNRNFTEMWNDIEKAILRKMRNEMSLICRIGSTFFTGDATKKQLIEVEKDLIARSNFFNNEITIKVNHHGSVGKGYKYLDFYKNMKPKQIVLKRDYQIQSIRLKSNRDFNKYVKDLEAIVPNNFVDSIYVEKNGMIMDVFPTF